MIRCEPYVKKVMKADNAVAKEVLQELWSGYGQLLRFELKGSHSSSVIVKQIDWRNASRHPKGWNTDLSHRRKLRSYQVESNWYSKWNSGGDPECYIPRCFGAESSTDSMCIVLEDLRELGYPSLRQSIGMVEIEACLKWLAFFHAKHLNEQPDGLWNQGTYWHLDTRPHELEKLKDIKLKNVAAKIDFALSSTSFKTLVHGDAKLANFCFSEDGKKVAAVDFQYIGGGCGMKDVAYFIGSCMDERACEEHEEKLLNIYFDYLGEGIVRYKKKVDIEHLICEWKPLYRMAWADFHRFLKGWSPEHWKINSYSERVVEQVINGLEV